MDRQETKALRCAIYTRKSVEEGLDMEFNSLDAQREAAESYIAAQRFNGWQLIPEHYDDGGFSGGNMNRPALKRLLKDCEASRIDIIVVYKIDRLSRSICDFAELTKIFDKHNVAFVSVTQEINTHTSAGRMMLNILITFAQFEREVIAERVRDKMAASRLKGKWVGGNVALGYRVEDHKLVIVPGEAETVRFIFRRFIETQSPKTIMNELIEKGIEPRLGKGWNTLMVNRLLNNYTYIGKVKYHGQIVEGEQEPIIDQETWDRVQYYLKMNDPLKDKTGKTRTCAPLRGILRCGHCGGAMSPIWTNKGRKKYYYYKCIVDSKRAVSVCPIKQISSSEVEPLVYQQLELILGSPEIQHAVAEVAGMPPEKVTTFLSKGLWKGMTPAERQKLVSLLVVDAVLTTEGLTLELRTENLESIIKEAMDATEN